MAGLQLKLLAGFEARAASGALLRLPTRKTEALLAYLALPPGRPHPRDALTALLWPDASDRQARQSLRQALFHLRTALRAMAPDAGLLVERGETVALDPGGVEVDVAVFEALVRDGAVAALERALVLYEGDLLLGLVVRAPTFEEWLMAERGRLHELALEALARLVAVRSQAGELDGAIQAATRLLALDPLQEAGHRALMRLYLRAGRRDAALRQYQICLEALRRELGTEPEPETRRIYQELVRQPAVAGPSPGVAPAPTAGPPLVGRAAELERLRAARAEAWRGEGTVVALVGEAGAGKTRLVEELVGESHRDGGRVLLGHAHELERVLPLAPWVEALRAGLGATGEQVAAELDPVSRSCLQLLLADPDPGSTRDRSSLALFEAVTQLLGQLAAHQPLLLVLEDLHWADEMSLRLLAFVSRRLGSLPVLVVATAREEELVGAPVLEQLLRELQVGGRLARVRLPRLTRAATGELVRAVARAHEGRAGLGRLADLVWRTSEGNPFMAVETIRAAEESTGARAPDRVPLPDRVRELISGRLDRLSPPARTLAAAAAVLGSGFGFAALQQAAGLDERTAAEGVEELVRRRILGHGEGELFAFDHDQIRGVAYERLAPARRQMLHAAAGAALERVHAGRLEEILDRLAHHYARAGRTAETVTYLGHFAEAARRRGALDEALRALDEALRHLDASRAAPEDRRRLEIALRRAQIVSIQGRFQEVFESLLPLGDVVERLGDPGLSGHYHVRLAIAFINLVRHTDAVRAANRAIEEARRGADDVVLGRAHYVLAITEFAIGLPREGVGHGRQAVTLLERVGDPLWTGQAYWILGLNHFLLGEFDAALAAEARVFALAETHGDRLLEGFAAYSTAVVHIARGDLPAAIAAAERGIARTPDQANRLTAQALLGYAHVGAGDWAKGIALMEDALRHVTRFEIRHSLVTMFLADAYLRGAELDRAREVARRGIDAARTIGFRWGVAWGTRLLGRIGRAAGDLDAAAARFAEAESIFGALAARFELAVTALDLAALAEARGDVSAAAARRAGACAELEALGARVGAAGG